MSQCFDGSLLVERDLHSINVVAGQCANIVIKLSHCFFSSLGHLFSFLGWKSVVCLQLCHISVPKIPYLLCTVDENKNKFI